jgi:hypothetical protein
MNHRPTHDPRPGSLLRDLCGAPPSQLVSHRIDRWSPLYPPDQFTKSAAHIGRAKPPSSAAEPRLMRSLKWLKQRPDFPGLMLREDDVDAAEMIEAEVSDTAIHTATRHTPHATRVYVVRCVRPRARARVWVCARARICGVHAAVRMHVLVRVRVRVRCAVARASMRRCGRLVSRCGACAQVTERNEIFEQQEKEEQEEQESEAKEQESGLGEGSGCSAARSSSHVHPHQRSPIAQRVRCHVAGARQRARAAEMADAPHHAHATPQIAAPRSASVRGLARSRRRCCACVRRSSRI